LKHGKKDMTEMRKGTECGISFIDWEEFQVGDQIQAFEEVIEKRHL
jgi:translation initiation factor IF-2